MPKRNIETDLLIIDFLTLALLLVVFAFPVPWLRIPLGFLFIVFFPGYVLTGALFPNRHGLSGITKIALSLGLSIAISIFIGLLLNYTPWGIRLSSLLISLCLFIILASIFSWYMRGRIGPEERKGTHLGISLTRLVNSLRNAGRQYQSLVILLLLIILGGCVVLGYIMTRTAVQQAFTEFYILGIEGRAENYHQELTLGGEGRVIVGIVNHEYMDTEYCLEVAVDGDELYRVSQIQLEPGERWLKEVEFSMQKVGDRQKVEFLLYKGENRLYGTRHIWLNVRA